VTVFDRFALILSVATGGGDGVVALDVGGGAIGLGTGWLSESVCVAHAASDAAKQRETIAMCATAPLTRQILGVIVLSRA